MNADLAKAQAVNSAINGYLKQHGLTSTDENRARARKALGIPPKGHKVTTKKGGKHTGMQLYQQGPNGALQPVILKLPAAPRAHHRRSGGGETIVPDAAGDDITTRTGARLHANIPGHVLVRFDGPAIGAMLGGMLDYLRYGTTSSLVTMFPERFPLQAAAAHANKQWAQERAIGQAEGQSLGNALRVYEITPELWAEIYVTAMASAAPMPRMPASAAPAGPGVSNAGWGSPLPQATIVTDDFGNPR